MAVVRQGCRVAQADADAALAASGADAARGASVDAVLVTTCAVTADAESAALQAIRRAAREHPGVPLVVCGCLGALEHRALARMDGVAAVLGPGQIDETARVLRATLRGCAAATGAAAPRFRLGARARPVLKVQDGCDQRCAYCIVPLARGASRSLGWEEALRRVGELGEVADEVVLAGVHLGVYGADLPPAASGRRPDLAALVSAVAERRLVHRLRLSSVDPLELPVEALRGPAAETLCPSFHLPVQSGADRVLRRMRRPYSAAHLASVVERIAAAAPGAFIGADVIAGFPGETAADHRDTVALLRSLPVSALHVFTFSPRPGTAAATLSDPVPAGLARERAAELRALSDARWRAAVNGLVGREVEAVVERVDGSGARGTTREGVLARWPATTARGAGADVRGEPRADDSSAPQVRRGRAIRLRALARDGDALLCHPA